MLNSGLACFSRIHLFLESYSRQHHILPLNDALSNQSSTITNQHVEAGEEIELPDLNLSDHRQSDSAIIDVRHVSFGWSITRHPIIKDVTFSVLRQSFLFIVGPVGCGKSTLLRGLMSETPSIKGFVYSDFQTMAFMDQTPWIQNISIRQNIVGQSNFEENWYEDVIRACALNQDIAALPNGHGMHNALRT
jgi:ATP-binding cassette, subfamily C (CFTR/MRP), member 1